MPGSVLSARLYSLYKYEEIRRNAGYNGTY
jgi:hypothetical protein